MTRTATMSTSGKTITAEFLRVSLARGLPHELAVWDGVVECGRARCRVLYEPKRLPHRKGCLWAYTTSDTLVPRLVRDCCARSIRAFLDFQLELPPLFHAEKGPQWTGDTDQRWRQRQRPPAGRWGWWLVDSSVVDYRSSPIVCVWWHGTVVNRS